MADSSLVLRETWVARVLRALKLVEVRPDGTTDHIAGADFADGQARAPGYKAINSMSALAAFPWVQASVDAVASDLSMLPIKVTKGRGKDAEPIADHPVLDLLDQPTSRMSGILMRRQLVTDLVLVGDAYLLVAGSPEPAALIRLHPERVTVVPSADGQAAAYDYDDGGKVVRYGWDQVLHIRQVSWEDGPRGLYGNGAIRALANDLTTEQKASELAANSADHGQPTGIFSPASEGDTWSQQQIAVMRDAFDRRMSKQGTALFLGSGVSYQPLSWSPRDMEYQATRHLVRESVMASIGVPPTRVGLPSANYATAREQAKRYFESLMAKAALVDSSLTRLARMFSGSEGVTVSHDFSGVEALQESRDARVNRVNAWWLMGVPLTEAAALEGFDEIAPDVEEPEADTAAPVAPVPGDGPSVSAQALNGAQIASLLQILGAVAAGSITFDAAMAVVGVAFPTITEEQARRILEGAQALPEAPEEQQRAALERLIHRHGVGTLDPLARWLVLDGGEPYQAPQTEDARADAWRTFIQKSHQPSERRVALNMRRYLRGAGARIAKRTGEQITTKGGPVQVKRQLDDIALDKILDEVAEREQILEIFRPLFRSMMADAINAASESLPVDVDLTDDVIRDLVTARVGTMVQQIQATTRIQVRASIVQGLEQGMSTAQIQQLLLQSTTFSPTRAMTIARTETTALMNQAGVAAMKDAENKGVRLQKEWLSARDGKVRDTHIGLDGQRVPVDGQFRSPSGATGNGPGEMGSAAENVNCRCVAVPFVEGVS